MKKLDSFGNGPCYQAKEGAAEAADIAALAARFISETGLGDFAVAVIEGEKSISPSRIKNIPAILNAPPRAPGDALWLSDGKSAECVWREERTAEE